MGVQWDALPCSGFRGNEGTASLQQPAKGFQAGTYIDEESAMHSAMIERELNENTMAAVWKYLKTIVWIHLQGLPAKTPNP
jgi:hypothetical protein